INGGKNINITQTRSTISSATKHNVTFNNVNTTTMTIGSKPDNAVNFKAEKETPTNNNTNTNATTTAFNITSAEGKPHA
ncbi:hypothetical protein, partial [Kingella kingae]|uniref:hypothetical protein n=1 Tax=Kingella kingae TaxID=504 RepID=UPI001E3C83CC